MNHLLTQISQQMQVCEKLHGTSLAKQQASLMQLTSKTNFGQLTITGYMHESELIRWNYVNNE